MFGRHNLAKLILATASASIAGAPALAHPHVFAEARLEVVIGDQGNISELRHVWRFDELFSATVLLEFDTNADLKFAPEELAEVSKIVHESLGEFNYYTFIDSNNKEVAIAAPDAINVDYQNGQLLMFFTVKPKSKLPAEGNLRFGVYDPTMYTAIDFLNDSDLVVEGNTGSCTPVVVRPDADEVFAQNQDTLTEAFFNDPEGNDFSKFFATRLELKCA